MVTADRRVAGSVPDLDSLLPPLLVNRIAFLVLLLHAGSNSGRPGVKGPLQMFVAWFGPIRERATSVACSS